MEINTTVKPSSYQDVEYCHITITSVNSPVSLPNMISFHFLRGNNMFNFFPDFLFCIGEISLYVLYQVRILPFFINIFILLHVFIVHFFLFWVVFHGTDTVQLVYFLFNQDFHGPVSSDNERTHSWMWSLERVRDAGQPLPLPLPRRVGTIPNPPFLWCSLGQVCACSLVSALFRVQGPIPGSYSCLNLDLISPLCG